MNDLGDLQHTQATINTGQSLESVTYRSFSMCYDATDQFLTPHCNFHVKALTVDNERVTGWTRVEPRDGICAVDLGY